MISSKDKKLMVGALLLGCVCLYANFSKDKPKEESVQPPVKVEQQQTKQEQSPNYKYIFKQDLPRITGAECVIDASTLEMNKMGNDFVIFHCTASIGGKPSQVEALYFSSDGKLMQMKVNNEVIFHEPSK